MPDNGFVTDAVNTADQVAAAIEQLSPPDLLRLQTLGKILTRGLLRVGHTDANWEDLLHEAILRAVAGQRHWPSNLDFRLFIAGTMRSIASSWKKRGIHVEYVNEVPNQTDFTGEIEAASQLAYANRLLASDLRAIQVLDCLSRGMNGPEITKVLGLSEREYHATIKRLRRKLYPMLRQRLGPRQSGEPLGD